MGGKLKITAEFEIVTPMFLGGAGHQASRIRESSIKGALAFWWRALNFGRFVAKAVGENEAARINDALQKMQKEEQKLFGGPKGQGVFLLRVRHDEKLKVLPAESRKNILGQNGNCLSQDSVMLNSFPREAPNTIGVGGRYLGYGLIEAFTARKDSRKDWENTNIKTYSGELTRSFIEAKQTFSLEIIFKSAHQELMEKEILPAIKLFGLLGGLGSRVRRGWGSIALKSLNAENIEGFEAWSAPKNKDKYKKALQELLNGKCNQSGTTWPLTAFASETVIRLGSNCNKNAFTVLNGLGIGLMKYRAWGKPKGKVGAKFNKRDKKYVGGFDVDASFIADHDWYRKDNGQPDIAPKRSAFGLPHNYAKWLGVSATNIGNEEFDRRASPLLFHIHKTNDGQSFAIALYFPNKFLHEDKIGIVRGTGRDQSKTPVDYTFDTRVIGNFLEGIKHDDNGNGVEKKDYFPSEQIIPAGGAP